MTITVAPMPTALTLLEAMTVPVSLDTLEMASHVKVCLLRDSMVIVCTGIYDTVVDRLIFGIV